MPDGVTGRLAREWKITNTNFDNDYSLEIEWDSAGSVDLSHLRLLVDDDGDFSDATVYSSSDGLTFSFGSIIIGGVGTTFVPKGTTKYITIGSADALTALPVELMYFKAQRIVDQVFLSWETSAEVNNDYFVLEKSYNGKDWIELTKVSGAGNSNQSNFYSYLDDYEGGCYYRLTQVDFDGTFEVFKTVFVGSDLDKLTMEVNPSPLEQSAEIKFTTPTDGLLDFLIYSQSGQIAYQAKVLGFEGENNVSVNTKYLKPGVYIFQLVGENGGRVQVRAMK